MLERAKRLKTKLKRQGMEVTYYVCGVSSVEDKFKNLKLEKLQEKWSDEPYYDEWSYTHNNIEAEVEFQGKHLIFKNDDTDLHDSLYSVVKSIENLATLLKLELPSDKPKKIKTAKTKENYVGGQL